MLMIKTVAPIQHMQLARRLLLGPTVPPIIARRRVGVAVAHHLLHRADVFACVQQVAGKGTA